MSKVGFKNINDHLVIYFKTEQLTDPIVLSEVEEQVNLRIERINLGQKVVVNFDGVDAASSQLVGLLLGIKKQIVDRFGTLTLCRVGSQLAEVLRLTRLERQFQIAERMRDVVGVVGQPSARRSLVATTTGRSETNWID